MDRELAKWLHGHIDAIVALNRSVTAVIQLHEPDAASKLQEVCYACNRARNIITANMDSPSEPAAEGAEE